MKGQTLSFILLVPAFLLIDLYVLNGLKALSNKWRFLDKKNFSKWYWAFSFLLLTGVIIVTWIKLGFGAKLILIGLFFGLLLFKVCFSLFMLIDDLRRIFVYLFTSKAKPQPVKAGPFDIPRSDFLLKAGLLAGAVPLAALKLNMESGLYDYQVKRHILYLPNLPKAFDGLKLGQISDIHSGSFYNKKAVSGGVKMLLQEKPDLIFFTGDLVNDMTNEMKDYQDLFSKVKAPLGVFSSMGNHDYGDYAFWLSDAERKRNLDDLVTTHKNMGWKLLRNENCRLKVNNEEIGILGVENWGTLGYFPKRANMDLTLKNTEDLPVKLLLSHDPSHWRAKILPNYPQIDVMFSGHTHGMQLGVQTKSFQWSPIEYVYNEWAGFYQEGLQKLYVNVGYGFIGMQGRVGILPEITIFELIAGSAPQLSKT